MDVDPDRHGAKDRPAPPGGHPIGWRSTGSRRLTSAYLTCCRSAQPLTMARPGYQPSTIAALDQGLVALVLVALAG
jgi:hypothetical protein